MDDPEQRAEQLEALAQTVRICTLCPLHSTRTRAVPGEGPADAPLLFIGEGPGANEDRTGRPFVGAAGQFLETLLASIGLTREDVFIANVVKCFISPRVLIYTSEGYKPIKDIRLGDLVLTHRGHFRKVVYIRPYEMLPEGSEVVRLTISPPQGGRKVRITVTPEHPFLIDGKWVAARDIEVTDRISTLGDRCEICGRLYFVRYDRYDTRTYHTCGSTCDNKRILHNPETREKIRQTMKRQYAEGLHDPTMMTVRANERTRALVAAGGEHFFVEAPVTEVEHRRTKHSFPLYNIGVEEDESYIVAGLVSHNCRPPNNRDPLPEEIAACKPYLGRQLKLLDPPLIVTLGRFAMERWLPDKRITRVHGQMFRSGQRYLVPLFHPAAALRNPEWKVELEQDFLTLPALLEEARALRAAVAEEDDESALKQQRLL